MVGIQNFNILIAEIMGVAVDKTEILPLHGVIFDAVAGGKRYLHPVIRNKKMVSASHDLMGGIVKQVFQIKFQFQFRLQIIGKIGFHQINGSGKIEPVIPQVDQNHPFFKR